MLPEKSDTMKKRLLFILLTLPLVLLLTGCQSDIECAAYGLPEGASVCYLAKDPERSFPPEQLKNTEIGDNSKDGWRYISRVGNSADDAKKIGTIKVAVYDGKGNILKISPEFPLVIKGRNYYWCKIAYNYKENSVEGISSAKLNNFIARWMFRLFVLDFVFFVIYIIVVSEMKKYHRYFPIKSFYLNIPNLGIITLWSIDMFSDYYNAPGSDRFDIIGLYLLFISAVIVVNIIGTAQYLKCRRKAKEDDTQKNSGP